MPTDISKLIEQTKNRRLKQHTTAQRTKVQAMGGSPKKGGPSILSRVFDVISRPLYGVSEGIARASEHVGSKNPRKGKNAGGDILAGIVGGLAGKNKTYMGDALLRAAEADPDSLLSKPLRENKGNLRTIAGFVGDVALDPLTYTGVGVARGVAKGAATTAGVKVAKESVETVDNVKRVLQAGDTAKQTRLAKGALKKGQTQEDIAKSAEKAAQKAAGDEIKIVRKEGEALGKAEELSILANNPGKVQFKFAGKTFAESEKLYKGTANIGKIVGNTAAGSKLSEAFRTAHKFPEKTNQLKREAEIRGIAHADIEIREMRKVYKDLSNDDKILISHTREKGPDAITAMVAARPELAPAFEHAQNAFREMGELEVKHGVFRAPKNKDPQDFLLDNYVYHSYEGGNKKARDAFKKMRRSAVGPESPNFTKLRQIKTLAEAKEYGLKPLENIDDILAKRIGKHHAAMSRSRYVDSVVKEYGVNVGSKWAAQMKKDGVPLVSVNSKYVPKGTVLPEHIAKSVEVLEKMHSSDELYNSFLRVFDKAQGYWKFGATSLNPGHHVRNLIGDAFNGFLDGVTNPKHYENAAKALWGKDDGFKLIVKGKPLTRPQLMDLYINSGAKPGFIAAELLQQSPSLGRGVKGKINVMAERREEYMRMAHFIHALKEEAPKFKNLDEAASEAAKRVRKWKLDYGDVTDFERNVMKRALPFYTWSRKNLPLQIEALAMRPGRIAGIPKATNAIESLLGTQDDDDLASIPKWMRQMSHVRLRGEGEGKNAIYWLPGLPFDDIAKYTEGGGRGIIKNIASQVTPFVKSPLEYASGKNLYTGANIKSGPEYAAGHLPIARNLYNIAKGKQEILSPKTGRYITGVGIEEVTPAQRDAELRRQENQTQAAIRSIRDKARKKAMGG